MPSGVRQVGDSRPDITVRPLHILENPEMLSGSGHEIVLDHFAAQSMTPRQKDGWIWLQPVISRNNLERTTAADALR